MQPRADYSAGMKAFWTYTLARLGVFLATLAVVWGVSRIWFDSNRILDLWVLLIALVISSAISIFALAGLRNQLAGRLQERASVISERIEESRRAEDVD